MLTMKALVVGTLNQWRPSPSLVCRGHRIGPKSRLGHWSGGSSSLCLNRPIADRAEYRKHDWTQESVKLPSFPSGLSECVSVGVEVIQNVGEAWNTRVGWSAGPRSLNSPRSSNTG